MTGKELDIKLNAAEAIITALMKELDDAYCGVRTLPRDHPALIAYQEASAYLVKVPA